MLSDKEIIKCQGHLCLIMKIVNQFGSLGKCTKWSMWRLGSAEMVWGLRDGSFAGFEFEVMDDEVRVANVKLDTSCWPAFVGTCNRIMTLLAGWLAPRHYLYKCWLIVNQSIGNKFQWHLIQNTSSFLQGNAIEYAVCKITIFWGALLCWLQLHYDDSSQVWTYDSAKALW